LHIDGSIRLSSDGEAIPTYSQDDTVGLAHVFTGWGPHYDELDPPLWNNGSVANRTGWFLYGNDAERPMTYYSEYGDEQPRTVVDGTVIPGGIGGEARMAAALDTLFAHPNVGPFVARHLIQRFVTSNPSPGYVYRVARVFNADAAGARGNLGATLAAVLLDPEARNVAGRTSTSFGRGAEPVLRMARILRGTGAVPPLRAANGDERFFLQLRYSMSEQAVLLSPSVFNFYLPSYSAPGAMAAAGLVAPEYQILTDTSVINHTNLIGGYLTYGIYTSEELPGTTDNGYVKIDVAGMVAILDNPARTPFEAQGDLIDFIDERFLFGAMSPELRASIRLAFANLPTWYGYAAGRQRGRVETALFLALTSPEGFVQR
jgi:hypothetical protein